MLPKSARFGSCLAALAVLLAAGGAARADNIDTELIKRGPELVDYLKKHNLNTVGVLRFRVIKGKEPPTFTAGPMNANMATRIENLVVLAGDDKSPIRVLASPGEVIAAQKKKLSYLNEAGRADICALKYPVRGGESARADAFLIGEVELKGDLKETTVRVRAFTPKQLKPEKIFEFSVPTDRSILNDVGSSFIITQRDFESGGDLSRMALRSVINDDDVVGKTKPKTTPKATPFNLGEFVDFKIDYDGTEQKIAFDDKANTGRVAEPQLKQEVVMKLKNLTDKRIGVVLAINGTSSIFGEDGDVQRMRKYVLDPKEDITIRGYQQKDMTVLPFRVAIPPDVKDEVMSASCMGVIQIAVFNDAPEKEKKISGLRGVTDGDTRATPPRNYEELKKRVQQATGLKKNARGAIAPDPDAAPIPGGFKEVQFDGTFLGVYTIQYLSTSESDSPPDKKKPGDDKK